MYISINIDIHIYIYTYIYIYRYIFMYRYVYIHIYMYMHVYVYTHIHIYTLVNTLRCMLNHPENDVYTKRDISKIHYCTRMEGVPKNNTGP